MDGGGPQKHEGGPLSLPLVDQDDDGLLLELDGLLPESEQWLQTLLEDDHDPDPSPPVSTVPATSTPTIMSTTISPPPVPSPGQGRPPFLPVVPPGGHAQGPTVVMGRRVAPIAPLPLAPPLLATTATTGIKRKELMPHSLCIDSNLINSHERVSKAVKPEPESKEAKKQKRLIRNRLSAQLHRERQKAHLDNLQAEVKQKDEEIRRLRQEVECLTRENACFRSHLCRLVGLEVLERLASESRSSPISSGGDLSSRSSPLVTSPEYLSSSEEEASSSSHGSSVGGWGGRQTGITLFAFLFLFSFLVSPSSVLVSRYDPWGRRSSQVHQQQIGAPSSEAGPLMPYRQQGKVLVSMPAPGQSRVEYNATGGSASTPYVFHPIERRPDKWRAMGQPWQYDEVVDVFSVTAVNGSAGKPPLANEVKEASNRLRTKVKTKATLKNSGDGKVKPYREVTQQDQGGKQVSLYRSGSSPSSSSPPSSSSSYVFCPQAYGMMGSAVAKSFQQNVLAASKSADKWWGGREGHGVQAAIVMPSASLNHTSSAGTSASRGNNATADLVDEAPYLLMLVPADGIDWGLGPAWGGDKASGGGWLEVGCRMTSIRMVSGVTFA